MASPGACSHTSQSGRINVRNLTINSVRICYPVLYTCLCFDGFKRVFITGRYSPYASKEQSASHTWAKYIFSLASVNRKTKQLDVWDGRQR